MFPSNHHRVSMILHVQEVGPNGGFRMLGTTMVIPNEQTQFDGLSRGEIKKGQFVQIKGAVEPNRRVIPDTIRLVRPE